jgi:hypothetical protein
MSLFLVYLAGLVEFGSAGSSQRHGCNAKALFEEMVVIGRFATVTEFVFVGAVRAASHFGSQGSQCSASQDLSATVFRQVAMSIAAAGKERGETSASKGALGKM